MNGPLAAVLVSILTYGVCSAAPPTFTKLWKGEQLWGFGGGKYQGSGDPKNWRSMAGAVLSFRYPGRGPLPEPMEFVVPIGRTLPVGNYRLFVKNFYRGEMDATLGDISKPLRIVRYDWTVGETFEINQVADKIRLRYFPNKIVADTGAEQQQHYIIQGVFLTTESSKVPIRGGEIIAVLPESPPESGEPRSSA